ncbi:Uncharacterised protein [Bordetella pertussis]|nr:Uncharacterised protein [Bordetella pertussis]CFP62733.1 Uncharacterised protein [Bordetella pertussis]
MSPRRAASLSVRTSTLCSSRPTWTLSSPCTCGRPFRALSMAGCTRLTATPARASRLAAPLSGSPNRAASTWTGSI